MGIMNVTPDSFSDGGVYNSADGIVSRIDEFASKEVDITDIGGESTRPGSDFVTVDEELSRVLPALRLAVENGLFVSVDTNKYEVAEAVLKDGAGMINDIKGMRDPSMVSVCAEYECAVCIMHMQGKPKSMQEQPLYVDVVEDVKRFLFDAAESCIKGGIKESCICLDPGFGFGKSVEDNYRLLNSISDLKQSGFPVLVGISRKSMIGNVINKPAGDRLAGTLAATSVALMNGADIVRAHDIDATADMIKIIQKVKEAGCNA
jgi:dihydropteroate synthase